MEKMNINIIERLSMKNICLMLNLDYEKAKVLKKIDIIHMLNGGLTLDQELEYKQKQVKPKPPKVKLNENEIKQKLKESQKKYVKTDKGKLALKQTQKKYHDNKKQPTK
jgi:hypothetical protein